MNKYQEALEKIGSISLYDAFGIDNIVDTMKHSHVEIHYKEFQTLEELVDRATPMKPIKGKIYDEFIDVECLIDVCPNCEHVVYENQCCSNNDCRQAIDWITK